MTIINPTQKLRGTTEENDSFLGPKGVITVDTEKSTIRVHDGKTPGGHIFLPESILKELMDAIVPVGTIISNGFQEIPAGYLPLFGSDAERTYNRFDYSRLFQRLISNDWITNASGDGATTFMLPDFRGRFLRCTGGSAATIGIPQGDEFRSHTHVQDAHNHTQNQHSHNLTRRGDNQNSQVGHTHPAHNPVAAAMTHWNTENTVGTSNATPTNQASTAINRPAGGTETRPLNFAVYYFIKY